MPQNENESLHELLRFCEYGDTAAAYASSTAAACPCCGAIRPGDRAEWYANPDDFPDTPEELADPLRSPDGPGHESDCRYKAELDRISS